jgi:hypothetical protein
VESTPLKGSVFQIRFPVPAAPYASEPKEQAVG